MSRILLVEDEDLLRWSLVERLTRVGHSVSEAVNLSEADDYVNRAHPDLILLDLALPDGHGLDYLDQHPQLVKDTIVIVLTAVGGPDDARRATNLGVHEFLTKPVTHDKLVPLIDRWLASS
jgi:DNA-binding NtrC family response regulator